MHGIRPRTQKQRRIASLLLFLCAACEQPAPGKAEPSGEATLGAQASALRAAPAGAARGADWGRQVAELSEPEGAFFSDTPLSNEDAYLEVASAFERTATLGPSVYLGVGPEQNLTFIAWARPALAFVVDLRRANLLLHALYKSLFIEAETAREWLRLCLGRAPFESAPVAPLPEWLHALRVAAKSPQMHEELLQRTLQRMRGSWGMTLEAGDEVTLRKHLETFRERGLDLRYETTDRNDEFPSLAELIEAKDAQGRARHFLADAASFRFLRQFQLEDRLVPVVGDLAGSHAVAAIAQVVRQRGLHVGSVYASNVEQYLLLDGKWSAWQRNLATLPRASDAILVRSRMSPKRSNAEGRAHWLLQSASLAETAERASVPASYADLFKD